MKPAARAALLVGGVAWVVYVFAACEHPAWLDASELAAAAFGLGVLHPPGHPLAVLLGKLVALLPLGSVAFRVSLASALLGAVAAAQVTRLGAHLARRLAAALAAPHGGVSERVAAGLGAAAGLLYAGSYAAAFQAVRPEVYALSTALVVTTLLELLAWDETGDRRRLATAALAGGLALSNHHLLALAVAIPAAVVILTVKPRAQTLGRVAAAGLLGLLLWSALPLRAAHHPRVDWGAPTTPARVAWVVSARVFQKATGRAHAGDAGDVVGALAVELGGLGALFAVGGAWLLLRTRATRRAGALVVSVLLLDAAAPALVGFDDANPDAYGYLAAAVAAGAALAVALPAGLLALRARGRAPSRGLAIATVALLLVGAAGAGAAQRPRWWLAGEDSLPRTLTPFLEAAPPDGLLIASYFQTVFGLWYLQGVEGRRPDVAVVERHFLPNPGFADELRLRHPRVAPLLGARDVEPAALPADAVVEYDVDLPAPLVARSRVVARPPGLVREGAPEAARFHAWQTFLAAHRACRLGDRAATAAAVEAAIAALGEEARPSLQPLLAGDCRTP